MKYLKKKLDGNYATILRAVFNKFYQQYPTKQVLYDHISQIIQVKLAGYCWRSKEYI